MFEAKTVMTTDIISVSRKTEIYEAIKILVLNNITGLRVVYMDMTLSGVISEKDMLKLLYNIEDKPANQVHLNGLDQTGHKFHPI